MTIEQIRRQLAVAAEESPAPPTRVTVTEIYRAGLRRRRVRRWASVAAVTVTAVGVAGGVAGVVVVARAAGAPPAPVPTNGPGASTGPGVPSGVVPNNGPGVPGEVRWRATELPDGRADAHPGAGGIFWVSFTMDGQVRGLGFELAGFRAHGAHRGLLP